MKPIKYLVALFMSLTISTSASAADNSSDQQNYLVFVGEKINLVQVPHNVESGQRDNEYQATYRVVDVIKGQYGESQIDFTVFDHYGEPQFAKYDHVLLYLVKQDNGYVHAKYQYSPLFKTTDNQWAGPYATADYLHAYNKETRIEPVALEFQQAVTFDVSNYDSKTIETWFPAPYYQVKNGQAQAKYGNYINELFLLKQSGVLKARGEFQ